MNRPQPHHRIQRMPFPRGRPTHRTPLPLLQPSIGHTRYPQPMRKVINVLPLQSIPSKVQKSHLKPRNHRQTYCAVHHCQLYVSLFHRSIYNSKSHSPFYVILFNFVVFMLFFCRDVHHWNDRYRRQAPGTLTCSRRGSARRRFPLT